MQGTLAVTRVERPHPPTGTIAVLHGRDEDTGSALRIACESSMAEDILAAIDTNEGPVYAEYEAWQVLR